jgi:diguanylate cyclase (GGDEF)-like protein
MNSKIAPPDCPVGESSCDHLDNLQQLRAHVEELTQLVSLDSLTGLFNRRHFTDTLPAVLERTRRSLRPACLILVDIDHFKNINDTWGHSVGDLALKHAARILQQQVRIVDTVCRYGGEEFAIILPDTELRQASNVAERIRSNIAETPLIVDTGDLSFTASLGIEVYQPNISTSAEALIDAADKFLYQAKHAGRNRVCHRDFAEVESQTEVTHEERDALRELFDD